MSPESKTWENLKSAYLTEVSKALSQVKHPAKKQTLEDVTSHLDRRFSELGLDEQTWENMQQIITAIVNAGKEVYLAKIPYIADPLQSANNTFIQAYNRVVDELVTVNIISVVPPDFYTYFESNQNEFYDDDLHPNGIGYQSIANMWFLTLNP